MRVMDNTNGMCNNQKGITIIKDGPTVVLDALSVSMDMSGMSELSNCLKKHRSLEARQAWAKKLWKAQEPCFQRMWADTTEGGGRDLMQLMAWEGSKENELCDTMELYGVLDVTSSCLREFMNGMLTTINNNSNAITGSETVDVDMASTSYLNVYSEACLEQVLFTNDFLKWQLRFGDMLLLLESKDGQHASS